MKIVVLGAGVVGVASAWYLSRAGHEVTVIDRQGAAAQETSFANGGQIAVSHAEPWANPATPRKIWQWLGQEDAPLLLRLRADPALWRWSWRFLLECRARRTRANIGPITTLAQYSRSCLQALRAELAPQGGLHYDQLQRGILHLYTDAREFEQALHAADIMRDYGCDRRPLTADECVAIEPALASARGQLVGGDFSAEDESGDAQRFTSQLAAFCRRAGVRFRLDTVIRRLERDGDRIVAAHTDSGERITADGFVLALGSYSPQLLRPLGLSLPVIPAKGYSATLTLPDDSVAPVTSLTDDQYKLVFSRLGQRLRIAGTAEFAGFDLALNPVRCDALLRRTRQLFPELRDSAPPEFWCGLRPVTPSSVPFIGASRYRNLWLNTGHGTLGWTMACGSGRLLADLIAGRTPDIAFPAPAL
ncbi:glycine/D-amino acid oxidase-like deaminating enzyme [Vogesella indigofera]|uniref:D-amino acid dehydrogenase n=1 Tax=Vogesella indigofera TaxID=45465 RepID=A0A495BGV3_VOGIN|nr:D-amino acid dehydrogenase [Vogesella indigofera]RKQ60061.1 glycine/D-amino acid oxidase-like deaminating enzyme [Vogesella indigofera]